MQLKQLEQQLSDIRKWLEDKEKTYEYAKIYEEISIMEKELHQLREQKA